MSRPAVSRVGLAPGLALVFAMAWPTVMTVIYFVVLASPPGTDQEEQEPSRLVQIAYSGGKAIQFLFPFAWVLLWERAWPKVTAPRRAGLGLGLGFGLLVSAAILALYVGFFRGSPWFDGVADQVRSKLNAFGLGTPVGFLFLAMFLSLLHSLAEEYYWRWFVFARLQRLVHLPTAVVLSSLAFMAHHVVVLAAFFPGRFLTLVLPFSLALAVGGSFWAWMYDRYGTLYPSWLSHALIDLAIMAVGYDLVFSGP